MGEQGGLRTGWIAAFGTEGYDGEPPLLEELGVNFGHIKGKVRDKCCGPCKFEAMAEMDHVAAVLESFCIADMDM